MSGDEGKGKDLKAEGLDLIAQGITLTLSDLKGLGIDSLAGVGRGFGNLELSGMQLGHEDLTSKFASFCERWEWGVRALVAEGNSFAEGVGLSAGTLYETDQYVGGAVKVGLNSLAGNPYAAEEKVEKMGYGDIAESGAYGGDVDYSKKSFTEAMLASDQNLRAAGHDVMTAPLGPLAPIGVGVTPEDVKDALDGGEDQPGGAG
ncbi:hypothetical protein NX794_14470 [Streptomyces sp. LP11]|uniref:Uncharacterized protein n=1 Tax=Streptomyces pyxinicus TaxID=2970331 RepID=A0ABT2B1M1_9ACTN|nr:hypothetical protein [Streptomyces sp. LP11]MCS0602406.1 hypothetical protein [Streptomyces sp. LP11]